MTFIEAFPKRRSFTLYAPDHGLTFPPEWFQAVFDNTMTPITAAGFEGRDGGLANEKRR